MLKLITDRTSSDVTRAKKILDKARNIESLSIIELEEYMSGLKGCYNISDLNRVESAVKYISELLNKLNYSNKVNVKSWNYGDFFTLDEELPRYLQNIRNLRNSIVLFNSTPQVPQSFKPYNYANDIEKILNDLEEVIAFLSSNFIKSGISNLGQSRLWQCRFRTARIWASQPYEISKFLDSDNVKIISSQEGSYKGSLSSNFNLPLVSSFDGVYESITQFNSSMDKIDNLIGYNVMYYPLHNLIPDSSFEKNQWNATNNNSAYSTTEKAFGNRSLYFAVGTTIVANIVIERPIVGHKYYGRRYIKSLGDNAPADSRFEVWGADGENKNWVYAWNNGNHLNWEFNSTIHEIVSVDYPETDRTIIRCFNVATTADTWIDGLMLIDLTECFGAGNEPTQEWCDINIPYFEENMILEIRKEEG